MLVPIKTSMVEPSSVLVTTMVCGSFGREVVDAALEPVSINVEKVMVVNMSSSA